MNEITNPKDKALQQAGLIMARPGESNLIYLGATKDITVIGSGTDRIYNELLDQMMDSINHDNTIMLTRSPSENTISEVMTVPMRGVKSASNSPEKKAGRKSNVVVSYSDMEHDKQRIGESDKPSDKVKISVMKRISEEFDSKIQEAEMKGDTLTAQDLKNKKNISWSIIKDEIDGVKAPREEVAAAVKQMDSTTPRSTYVAGYEPWKNVDEERISQVTSYVMNSKDKYIDVEDYKMKSNISTSTYGGYNKDLRGFTNFMETGDKYYAYDIETIGNALDSNRFSVVEIAAQGYKKDSSGKHKMLDGDRYTALIELLPEERKSMGNIITKLKEDKYAFNALSDFEKRSAVDLMRYSTIEHSAEKLRDELQHNPIIGKVYGKNEKILSEVIIDNMDEMIGHMESALENLTYRKGKENIVIKAEDAQKSFNAFVQKNNDALFVGHNSQRFDDRKLKEWHSGPSGKNMLNEIVLPEKRLDFMNLVQSVYPDARKLLEQLWEQSGQDTSKGIHYEQGHNRLYEFQRALELVTDTKHSALADVDDKGLGGVFAAAMDVIKKDIVEGKSNSPITGIPKNSGTIMWSDDVLKTGQVLYADRGYQNRDRLKNAVVNKNTDVGLTLNDVDTTRADLSFSAEYDPETNTFKRITSDFNTTIINSKSFYEVQGLHNLEEGKVALRLYDRDQNKYAFIVREGEYAVDEIQDFVQKQFYSWDGNNKKDKKRIVNERQKDLARRRYEKMFSLSRTDMGRTGGYQSADRYFKALDIYNKRIEGKNLNIEKTARENVLANNEGKKVSPKKLEKLVKAETQRLRNERMSHETFVSEIQEQFMTKWNPSKTEWEFNEEEYKAFFHMKDKLQSEQAVFAPMLQAIEKEYGDKLREASANVEAAVGTDEFDKAKKAYAEIARQADRAWISYANDLDGVATNIGKKREGVLKEEHQRRQFKVADGNKERTINAYDLDTAKSSISSYAYSGLKHVKDKEQRDAIVHERMVQMVQEMKKGDIVSEDIYERLINAVNNNAVNSNAVTELASILSGAEDIRKGTTVTYNYENTIGEKLSKEIKSGIFFEKRIDIADMGKYNVELQVDQDHLNLLARQHVEHSKAYLDFNKLTTKTEGKRYKFNETMEKLFEQLDGVDHMSGLVTNNRLAVENLVDSILANDPDRAIGFSIDTATNNLVVSVNKGLDNTVMMRELAEGKTPTSALNISVPLVGSSGTHRIGERILNARTYMEYSDATNSIVERSSVEKIVSSYTDNMKKIMSQLDYVSVDMAQETTRKLLGDATRSLAGIQRGSVSYNDTNYFSNTMADFIKQSHVDVQDALIKQMFYGEIGSATLSHEDFVDPKKKIKDGKVVGNVSYEDLKFDSQYKTALALENFIEHNKTALFTSGMKDDDHAGQKLSKVDVRVLSAFRDFIAQTRANSIQAANAVILEPDVIEKLNAIGEKGGAYVTTNQHVVTDMERDFLARWSDMKGTDGKKMNEGKALGFDMKVMYMNDKDVYDRLQWMADQEDGLKILKQEGMLELDDLGEIARDEDGKVKFDASSTARVYEQQIMINKDIVDALKGKKSKVFHNVEASKAINDLIDKHGFAELKEGMAIGRDENGRTVRWEKDRNAKLTIQNGKVVADWSEDLFKLQVGGEKGTVNPFSQEFMQAFTGSDEVAAVMNPNVVKHKDLGMLYESKAGLFTQKARELSSSKYVNEKGKVKLKDTSQVKADTALLAQLNEDVKAVGLEWDAEAGQYVERVRQNFANEDIDYKAFGKILADDKYGFKGSVDLEVGAMKKAFEVGVINTVANAVYDYSRVIDGTGKEVIGMIDAVNDAGEKVTQKIYAESKGMRGVAWGHRELSALRQKGLNETADQFLEQMLTQGDRKQLDEFGNPTETIQLRGRNERISRIQETHNIMEAIEQMVDPTKDAPTINVFDGKVKGTPNFKSNIHTMRGSIFDKQHILETIGPDQANQHGYWLELPDAKLDDGTRLGVSLNVHGTESDGYTVKERVKTNKVFIPYTNLEGAGGDIHLRALQKNIADIHRRAKEVGAAGNEKDRIAAVEKLQTSVDDYTKRLVYDVTSSKGLFGQSVGRVNMGFTTENGATSSANGLFKLIDPMTSAKLEGEYTFISEDMAKKLGIDKQLANGGEMYAMNNRYPTFHHDAMQVTKLKIGNNVRGNEMHTTAFFSNLLKADSDGDYNNITVDTSQHIQDELALHYKKEQGKYKLELEEFQKEKKKGAKLEGFSADTVMDGKPATGSRKFSIDELADAIQKDDKDFRAGQIMERNTAEEIAAKIGKKTIGMASNLNLQMQQVAKEYLGHDTEMQEAMFNVGQTLEQKLISSKHGASVGNGKSPAMEFINHIKNSGTSDFARNEAIYYAKKYFSDIDFGENNERLTKALDGIRYAQERSSMGIKNPGFAAGTSGGINAREGLENVRDIIKGHVDPADVTTANSFNTMIRHATAGEGEELPKEYRLAKEHAAEQQERQRVEMPESRLQENTRKAKQTLREKTGEATGFVKENFSKAIDKVNSTPKLKTGLIGGGIALAGLGMYNIATKDNPVPEVNQQSKASPIYDKPAKSALPSVDQSSDNGNSQAVNVRISAQGNHNINKGAVGGAVSTSLNNSGVSSSGANMHITQRDNSQNLNQIWYRDKVQENI